MRNWKWRKIVQNALLVLSAGIVLAAAIGALTISQNTPAPAVTDQSAGGADQDAVYVDPYMMGGVSNHIADALRNCPGNENAWAVNGGTRTPDVKKLKPCLHSVTIALLRGDKLTVTQAKPGYNISITSQTDGTQSGVKASFTNLDYQLGDDTLFAAAIRYQDTKGTWSAWSYRSDLMGIYQIPTYTYQIALFSYDAAHEASSDPTATLPEGFDWSSFMPQMLVAH